MSILGITTAQAQDLNHCTVTKLNKGNVCGTLPGSMELIVTNNCSVKGFAKFCFENATNQWECMSDIIYPKEDYFGFMTCNTTGRYMFDICSGAVKGCNFNTDVPFSELSCGSKTITYTINVGPGGTYRILTDKGLHQGIKRYKGDLGYYIKASDITKALCDEPLPADLSWTEHAINLVKHLINSATKAKYKECLEENASIAQSIRESDCKKKIYGRSIPKKIPGIGVLG